MILAKLCSSLTTSEKLRAAGFGDATAFAWYRRSDEYVIREARWAEEQPAPPLHLSYHGETYHCAAPTFAEIAERLPGYEKKGESDIWRMIRWRGMYLVETFGVPDDPLSPCRHREAGDTAAEAAALLWLTLHPAPLTLPPDDFRP